MLMIPYVLFRRQRTRKFLLSVSRLPCESQSCQSRSTQCDLVVCAMVGHVRRTCVAKLWCVHLPVAHTMLPARCMYSFSWLQSAKFTSVHNNALNDFRVGNVVLECIQDAKELLYRLFKAGFVGLQDVPRTADHAPSRTLYTWSVNNEAAADKLAAELYKAAFNVYVRCTNEFEQHKEVSHV